MSSNKSQMSSHVAYNIQYTSTKKEVDSPGKEISERATLCRQRDSPTSSILKTPTPIFLTTRNSSVRTKKLKFANGPDSGGMLNDFREGSKDSGSTASGGDISDLEILNNNFENEKKFIEVALSSVKMKVSPDSWNAFLEYQKYEDHSNETEKTDYTYSRLSKFRDKEIIPGFRIRPNLSRRPIRLNSSYDSGLTASPETSYCVKKTVYELGSGKRSTPDGTEREMYRNEMSEYGAFGRDGYSNNETIRFDEKYQTYTNFGDDGRILRGRRGFPYGSLNFDKQSHLRNQWGYDETDDDFITSTNRREKSTVTHSVAGSVAAFVAAIYATIASGVFSTLTLFKDLFSKYILRRRTGDSPHRYSRVTANSWTAWSKDGAYTYPMYTTSNQGRLSKWWYNSFLYAVYSKIMTSVSSSTDYIRSKYYRSSRKGRLLWFIIPLLLLLGLCVLLRNFLPNPDTILNIFVDSALAIWSIVTYPFLALPRFAFDTLPGSVSGLIDSASESLSNLIVKPAIHSAEFALGVLIEIYLFTSHYLIMFYSNFCVFAYNATGLFGYVSGFVHYLTESIANFWYYLLGR